MTQPFYRDEWLTIYSGDCREVMAGMPAESVDCVVTSPPYWGLRDYGIPSTAWGGDPDHAHEWAIESVDTEVGRGNWAQGVNGRGEEQPGGVAAKREPIRAVATRGTCSCGAWLGTHGLEPTPEMYVAHAVEIFRAVHRVLKPTGTIWVNLGDSYAANGQPGQSNLARLGEQYRGGGHKHSEVQKPRKHLSDGLKPKDLVGIPWMVAFALRADGWYLRKDIIWHKKNGMPESVSDRPTSAHEYIFLLSKEPRYYYDADAVRQEPAASTVQRLSQNDGHPVWNGVRDRGFPGSEQSMDINRMLSPAGANLRDVWSMATMPYPGAHFAVFPPELPERCIKAGSSEKGVCSECGAPWERVVERTAHSAPVAERTNRQSHNGMPPQQSGWYWKPPDVSDNGWQPTCKHEAEPIPATILDPFGGSGTTAMVAQRLSRRAVLIDLNPEYVQQQMERNAQTPLGLDAA